MPIRKAIHNVCLRGIKAKEAYSGRISIEKFARTMLRSKCLVLFMVANIVTNYRSVDTTEHWYIYDSVRSECRKEKYEYDF